jgi:hypothetical protein
VANTDAATEPFMSENREREDYWILSKLTALENEFRTGNDAALLELLFQCAYYQAVIPDWAADALLAIKARLRSGELLSLDKEFNWKPEAHAKTLQMSDKLEKFMPHVLVAALHWRCGTAEDDQYNKEDDGAFDTAGLDSIAEMANKSATDLINSGVKKISRRGVKAILDNHGKEIKKIPQGGGGSGRGVAHLQMPNLIERRTGRKSLHD